MELEFYIFRRNQVYCSNEIGFLGWSLICHDAFQRLFVDFQVDSQVLNFLSSQEELSFEVVDFLERLDQLRVGFGALIFQGDQFLLQGGNV